jgi:hypothetical protein
MKGKTQMTIDLDPDEDNADLVTSDELSPDDWEDLKVIFDILLSFCTWSLQLLGYATDTP